MTTPDTFVDHLLDAARAGIAKARDFAKQIDIVDLELTGLYAARDRLNAVIADEHAYDVFLDGTRKAMRDNDLKTLEVIQRRITLLETERARSANADTAGTTREQSRTVRVRALIDADVEVDDAPSATRAGVERALRSQLPDWVAVAALTVVGQRSAPPKKSFTEELRDALRNPRCGQ